VGPVRDAHPNYLDAHFRSRFPDSRLGLLFQRLRRRWHRVTANLTGLLTNISQVSRSMIHSELMECHKGQRCVRAPFMNPGRSWCSPVMNSSRSVAVDGMIRAGLDLALRHFGLGSRGRRRIGPCPLPLQI
jgi:hypothetical protein